MSEFNATKAHQEARELREKAGADRFTETLCKLLPLPPQFMKLVLLSDVDASKLLPNTAPLYDRAEDFLKAYAQKHQGDLRDLKRLLLRESPNTSEEIDDLPDQIDIKE